MTLGQERWLLHAPGGRFLVAWPVYVGEERSEVGPVPTDGDLSGWALAGWGGEGWEVVARLRPRNGLPCADCPHSLGQHAGGASSVPGAGCEVHGCACAGWRPSDDTHLELALLARLGVVGRCRLAKSHVGDCSPLPILRRCRITTWAGGRRSRCERRWGHAPPHVWLLCGRAARLPASHSFGLALVVPRCAGCGDAVLEACGAPEGAASGPAPCLLAGGHPGGCFPVCPACWGVARDGELLGELPQAATALRAAVNHRRWPWES